MFNIVHVKIVVELLLVADMIRAMEYKVRPLEIGTSGTIPCGHIENDPEVRVVQWYKSRNITAFENGDPSLASWTPAESGSLPNYHMENTTFSLVIRKATLQDEGLYKCIVIHGGSVTRSSYFIRTVTYALPRMDPIITLDTDLNRVHCAVEHVKPAIYPVFNFDYSHVSTETYVVLNEDGTFTTSVSCTLPETKSVIRVDCSFSYSLFQRVGSLDLRDTTTDSLIEVKTTSVSPIGTSVTFAGDGCQTINQTAIMWSGIVIGLLILANFIMLIMLIMVWRKFQRVMQNCNKKEDEKMI